MNGVRKVALTVLAVILLASLLGAAFATATKHTVSNPQKIEKWLAESKIYDHFVMNAVEQGQASVGSQPDNKVQSLSDTAVQDAAKNAFSQQLVQNSINKFIESNYDWLEGKTAKPDFVIDLTSSKQSFAEQVGGFVTKNIATLPVCTDLATAQAQAADPLNATCRPPNVSPEATGALVTQRISASDELLGDPVLTAQNINPEASSQSKPYYEKLAHLPKVYQFGQNLPYIFAATALVSVIGIIFASAKRRSGFKKVGIIFAVAGLILVVIKFTSDVIFKQAEDRVFNTANSGELQRSLTSFAHQLENSAVNIQFIFGLAFLLIALIILVTLRINKVSGPKEPLVLSDLEPIENKPPTASRLRAKRPANSEGNPFPPRSKPPRLVQ